MTQVIMQMSEIRAKMAFITTSVTDCPVVMTLLTVSILSRLKLCVPLHQYMNKEVIETGDFMYGLCLACMTLCIKKKGIRQEFNQSLTAILQVLSQDIRLPVLFNSEV